MLRPLLISSACLVFLFVAGCKPCGCEKASLETIQGGDPPNITGSITFDESFFFDDKFEGAFTINGQEEKVSGTYDEDGDTLRFDTEGGKPFLGKLIESGKINKLECDKPRRGSFTITLTAKDGNPPLMISFLCTQR